VATFEKRGDKIRAKVEKLGVQKSKTFTTMREARDWATSEEAEILAGKSGNLPDKTFGQLLERYAATLDEAKRRADIIRIKRLVRDDKISEVKVKELSSTHAADWRDKRLKQVSAASVRREWNLLSPACKVAIKEWGWLKDNPFAEVKRPPKPDARDRRPTEDEIKQIKHVSGYDEGADTQTARVCTAFLFAIETGMRIGEICNLKAADVHLDDGWLQVTGNAVGARKTRGSKRDVALSAEAKRLLQSVECDFKFTSSQVVDALWRTKIIAKTGIENLHFHDSRAEAVTRLSKKLDILALARMIGHTDLRSLQVYYRPSASDIAKLL
jgi:integrase